MNMKLASLLVVAGVVSAAMAFPAVFDQSSLDHLIIPYEDDFQPNAGSRPVNSDEEPYVITTYNIGSFRGGDHLEVPLGASYIVSGPESGNRLKKGLSEKRLRPGIVL